MRGASWSEPEAQAIIDRHLRREGPLLPILHDMQAAFGHVPRAAIPLIAEALNLSRAEVYGVVTFYHDFTAEPHGRHVLKLCRAEACQSRGGEALVAQVEAALGVACGETTADGRVTFEPVYCLGLCATAPSAMVDGRIHGRMTPEKVAALLAEVSA